MYVYYPKWDPLLKRKRSIIFPQEYEISASDIIHDYILLAYGDKILPGNDIFTVHVKHVLRRLLLSTPQVTNLIPLNAHNMNWEVYVIDDMTKEYTDMSNDEEYISHKQSRVVGNPGFCYALPNGKVYITTSAIKNLDENEISIGLLLSREIVRVALRMTAETISNNNRWSCFFHTITYTISPYISSFPKFYLNNAIENGIESSLIINDCDKFSLLLASSACFSTNNLLQIAQKLRVQVIKGIILPGQILMHPQNKNLIKKSLIRSQNARNIMYDEKKIYDIIPSLRREYRNHSCTYNERDLISFGIKSK